MGPLGRQTKHEHLLETFANLGKTWDISQRMLDDLQFFTCRIYAPSSNTVKVNELRYEMFFSKRGEVESSALPPCEGSLQQHIRRVNYQAAIWRRCLVGKPDVPEPDGHGWTRDDDGNLGIDWMHGTPAPDSVLECVACQCKR